MTITRSRRRKKGTKTGWNREKKEQNKDWTKKKIKEITEAVQKMTNEEFYGLEESLRVAFKSLRK